MFRGSGARKRHCLCRYGPLDITLEDDGPFVRGEEVRITCRGDKSAGTRLEEVVAYPSPMKGPVCSDGSPGGGGPKKSSTSAGRATVKECAKRDPENVESGFPDPSPQGLDSFRHAGALLTKLSDAFVEERCLLRHPKARQNALTSIWRDNLLQSPCQCQEIRFSETITECYILNRVFQESGEG